MTSFGQMSIYALAEPGRRVSVVKSESHQDKVVQRQFRSTFGRYFDHPDRFPSLAERCPFCFNGLIKADCSIITNIDHLLGDTPNEDLRADTTDGLISGKHIAGYECEYSPEPEDIDLFHSHENDDIPEYRGAIEYCRRCRYWKFYCTQTDTFPRGAGVTLKYVSFISKTREYETELPEGLPDEVAIWLRRNTHRWHTMSPPRFERFIADVFRYNYAAAEVTHVGRPDDGGADILLVESEGHEWLIEVKRREDPAASEGVSTLRNLLGAMLLKGPSMEWSYPLPITSPIEPTRRWDARESAEWC